MEKNNKNLIEKIELCFDKGCPNYGYCSNNAEMGLEEIEPKTCLYYFLMKNDIKVKDNGGNILTDEELWTYINAGKIK